MNTRQPLAKQHLIPDKVQENGVLVTPPYLVSLDFRALAICIFFLSLASVLEFYDKHT